MFVANRLRKFSSETASCERRIGAVLTRAACEGRFLRIGSQPFRKFRLTSSSQPYSGNSSKLPQLFPTAGVIGRNRGVKRTPPLTIYPQHHSIDWGVRCGDNVEGVGVRL